MSVPMRRRGTAGTPLSVTTNSFKIESLPRKTFYQYDAITPEPRHPRHAQEIVDRLQTHTAPDIFRPKALYDGQAILFASHQLHLSGGGSGNFNVSMSDRQPPPGAPVRGVYSIKLTRAAAQVIDFSALTDFITGRGASSPRTLTAINILQLLIRAAPNLMYPHNLRAYYTSAGKKTLDGGLELWRGYFQSVRPSIGQMLVNVDVSVSAMYGSGPLPNVALSVLRSRNARDLDVHEDHVYFRKLKNFLKNLLVMVTPTGGPPNARSRKKKIRGLVANAGNFEFDKDGRVTTVKVHFQEAHGYSLRQPQMFGILVGGKEKAIVFPAEVCTIIEGQIYKKKVPPESTPEVVKFATSKPDQRLATIQQGGGGLRAPVFEYPSSPFMQDAGMQVSPTPIRIEGRVLPTPTLVFGDSQPMRIQNGGWNVTKNKFKEPMPLVAWAVVDYAHNQHKAHSFVEMLLRCFQVLGMKYLPPYTCGGNGQGNISGDLMSVSHDAMSWAEQRALQLPPNERPPKPSRIALIICILPFPATEVRRAIKHFGDVETGIPTQCIRTDKITDGNRLNQYCNNVALKINVRLGGLNSITSSPALQELQKGKFMIVGADVGHPGAGINNQPSVASMVWSFDQHAMKYVAFSSVQEPRQESIQDLGPMMKRALDAFGQMQAPPARIVMFRDGLSEGEWQGVGELEIKAIDDAINEIWELRRPPFPKPKLTYIVVGKRHHVRFFPKSGDGDRSGNCPPGFVADAGIDNPLAADFYLQSHGGLLGTSRPSHYTILKDDIFGNNPDALQQLAYTLCHCYAKATRSVSIPCPVYYADLVCARANFHFDPNLRYDDASSVSSGATFDIKHWKDGYRPLHAGLKKSMYFL